jgi:FkbM family methyltransferase
MRFSLLGILFIVAFNTRYNTFLADTMNKNRTKGEDRCLIENFFPGICEGKYLEVGALDGIRGSNTYAFHKVLGWKGVNIEVNPDNYERLSRNRRGDLANVHAAVCSDPQKVVHYAIGRNNTATGGIWEYASEAHREKYWTGMTIYDAIPTKCTPLQSILDMTVGTRRYFFDLAILDIEGAEFSALLGIDYNQISFGVIIVEKNADGNINQSVEDLLSSKGYSITNVEAECGAQNLWFVHFNFHNIYKLR